MGKWVCFIAIVTSLFFSSIGYSQSSPENLRWTAVDEVQLAMTNCLRAAADKLPDLRCEYTTAYELFSALEKWAKFDSTAKSVAIHEYQPKPNETNYVGIRSISLGTFITCSNIYSVIRDRYGIAPAIDDIPNYSCRLESKLPDDFKASIRAITPVR